MAKNETARFPSSTPEQEQTPVPQLHVSNISNPSSPDTALTQNHVIFPDSRKINLNSKNKAQENIARVTTSKSPEPMIDQN